MIKVDTDRQSRVSGGGDASPFKFKIYPASKANVEGEAPSGFAGGGGDASPFKIGKIGI